MALGASARLRDPLPSGSRRLGAAPRCRPARTVSAVPAGHLGDTANTGRRGAGNTWGRPPAEPGHLTVGRPQGRIHNVAFMKESFI
jgi:hypothetical protein